MMGLKFKEATVRAAKVTYWEMVLVSRSTQVTSAGGT